MAAANPSAQPMIGGVSLKYVSLVVLCLQNSSMAILMRLATTGTTGEGGDKKFNSSTAVVMGELFKVGACVVIVLLSEVDKGVSPIKVITRTVSDSREMMRVGVPALLYLIQNNLQYVSIANLDAATFQVLYQLKILTTAIFSVTLLNKRIIPAQWFAIVLLMIGVALVQMQPTATGGTTNDGGGEQGQNKLLGLITVILACCCSGFAGVYFEKILKHHATKASIWERNIQMGLISAALGLIGLLWNDREFLLTKGFYYGYRPTVWVAVCVNAFGGLLTAMVVKYADNILKAFATSIAIVISCILSIFLFDKIPMLTFMVGALLVNGAVYIYGVSPSWPKTSLPAEHVDEKDIEVTAPLKEDDDARV